MADLREELARHLALIFVTTLKEPEPSSDAVKHGFPMMVSYDLGPVADECIRQMEWARQSIPAFGADCSQRPWWTIDDEAPGAYGGEGTILGGSRDDPDTVARTVANTASARGAVAKLIVESVNLRCTPLTLAPPDWKP